MNKAEHKISRHEELRIQSQLDHELLHKKAKQELFQLHVKTCIQISITLLVVASSSLGYIVNKIAEPANYKVVAFISILLFAYSMYLGTCLFVDSLKRINSERYSEHVIAGLSRDLINPTRESATLFQKREMLTNEMNKLDKTIKASLKRQYVSIIAGGVLYGIYLSLPQILNSII